MNKKRSLDDTCTVFLSRSRRTCNPFADQCATSERAHYAPALLAENMENPSFCLLPRPLDLPQLSATGLTASSTKPLPLPGSSGEPQPKPVRLANGRHHVPRPRNPFIMFRCDLVHQRKVLPRSDLDDTNISRIAGDLWREMTAAQKKPWVELAAEEKARHAKLYPDYKYAPTHNGPKGKKGKHDNVYPEDRPPRQVSRMGTPSPSRDPKPSRLSERPRPYPQPVLRRRPSSCPPVGAIPIPPQSPLDGWTPALVTQDDSPRRPGRTVMYQSVAPVEPAVEPAAATEEPDGYDPLVPSGGYDWLGLPPIDLSMVDSAYTLPDLNQATESLALSKFNFFDHQPTLTSGTCDPGFTEQDLERLAFGTTFTDPFATLGTAPVDQCSPYMFSSAISPFDHYSTGPASLSSGTYSTN